MANTKSFNGSLHCYI